MRNTENTTNRHLYIVPAYEPTPPASETAKLLTDDPTLSETVTLRIDARAFHLLQALSGYDQVSPAQEYRTALTLYIASRMGDTAVKEFIQSGEQTMREIFNLMSHDGDN